jgi:basic membrane protein A and related proteins
MRSHLRLLSFTLCLLTATTACKKEESTPATKSNTSKPSVGLVLGLGGRGDQAFNDSALRGLELWAAGVKYEKAGYLPASNSERQASWGPDLAPRASELGPLGITPVVLQSRVAEDYEPNLQLLAEQQVSLAMGVGFMLENAVEAVARRNPSLPFLLVDSPLLDAQGQLITLPNVRTVVFREEEGCFLAGALAGLVTKTGKVGMVGGMKVPLVERYEAGFREGFAATNPRATMLVNYTGSFTDFALGKQVGQDLVLKDVDVVFAAAGVSGLGAIQAVKEAREAGRNVFVIGVDSDPSHLAPQAVLSAVEKRVDLVVYEAIREQLQGRLKGGNVSLGLKEGGMGLSPVRLDFPGKAEALRTLEELRARIISGELKVPTRVSTAGTTDAAR